MTSSLPAEWSNDSNKASRKVFLDVPAPLADQLNCEETVQPICDKESPDPKKIVTYLETRLEEELNRKPEFEEDFKNLHEELSEIKKYLAENSPSPTESVTEAVKRLL